MKGELKMDSWFNLYGTIAIAVIMIPNIIFALLKPEGFTNVYRNKFVEVFEQIGRVGSFVFMCFNVKPLVFGFVYFGDIALNVYRAALIILTIAYVVGWIFFKDENSVRKSLYLSIVPSALFLVCGLMPLNIPLIVSSVIFAPCHILISYKNAKGKQK